MDFFALVKHERFADAEAFGGVCRRARFDRAESYAAAVDESAGFALARSDSRRRHYIDDRSRDGKRKFDNLHFGFVSAERRPCLRLCLFGFRLSVHELCNFVRKSFLCLIHALVVVRGKRVYLVEFEEGKKP